MQYSMTACDHKTNLKKGPGPCIQLCCAIVIEMDRKRAAMNGAKHVDGHKSIGERDSPSCCYEDAPAD